MAVTSLGRRATFSEPVQPATVSMTLTGPSGAVAGTTSYDAASQTATFTPSARLANSTSYTATVSGAKTRGQHDGRRQLVLHHRRAAAPAARRPGGPILLVSSSAQPFSSYLAEILRTEGLNEFTTIDVSQLAASQLAGNDIVRARARSR